MAGANLHLKAENLHRSGPYKIRGATYKLSRLSSDEHDRGERRLQRAITPKGSDCGDGARYSMFHCDV